MRTFVSTAFMQLIASQLGRVGSERLGHHALNDLVQYPLPLGRGGDARRRNGGGFDDHLHLRSFGQSARLLGDELAVAKNGTNANRQGDHGEFPGVTALYQAIILSYE